MKIRFVYWIFPVFIIKTEKFLKEWQDGYSFVFFVLMKEYIFENEASIIHELEHTKQFLRTFGLHSLLYYLFN